MRILVTGANGYLGRGIVKSLLDYGQEVIATDLSTTYVDPRAHLIDADLFGIEDPYRHLGCPDVLLHLAWTDGFVHYSDAHIQQLPKHYQFIQKMAVTPISRIAVMGSMHEIGFYEGSIREDTPCCPVTPYGIAKNALRQLTDVVACKHDLEFQWLRGFYIVGNTEAGNSIFSKIVKAAHGNETEFPFTKGLNQFDFLDYDAFCQQVTASVIQNRVLGIINICSGRPEKLADRVERFIEENHFAIHLQYGAFPDRPYDSKAVWGDSKKIQQILSDLTSSTGL